MAYQLKSLTIRADNSKEGMAQITELWADITSGRLPLLFNSAQLYQQGISPIARYSRYEADESGAYDLSILAVTMDFFQELEQSVFDGQYEKFEASGDDLGQCAQKAWDLVWTAQAEGTLRRTFGEDYECTIPAQYSQNGTNQCILYISKK